MSIKKLSVSIMVVMGLVAPYVLAGNREMIEENVRELDELNRDAIRHIPELPSRGVVEVEAYVLYQKGLPVFEFTSKRITPERNEEVHFTDGQKVDSDGTKGQK